MTDAARESRASLTKAVLKECAPESDPAVLQQLEKNAQAAVSDLLTQAVEPQRLSQSSAAGVPVEEAEAELARAGAEEAADELRRDTVRLMKITDLAPSVLVKIKLGVRKSTQLKKVLDRRGLRKSHATLEGSLLGYGEGRRRDCGARGAAERCGKLRRRGHF